MLSPYWRVVRVPGSKQHSVAALRYSTGDSAAIISATNHAYCAATARVATSLLPCIVETMTE